MESLSYAILDGNLVADPELRQTAGGKSVAKFTLAVNDRPHNGNSYTSFIMIESWGRIAENAAQYLTKGSRVTVQGRIRQQRWADNDGKTQSRIVVVANSIRFDSKPTESVYQDSDIPY